MTLCEEKCVKTFMNTVVMEAKCVTFVNSP